MSRKKDYLQKLNAKKKDNKKKKQIKLHNLKESENYTNLDGENKTGDQRVTALETSENAAPLLEVDDNAEYLSRKKKKLLKNKEAKGKMNHITKHKHKDAQLEELVENPLNNYQSKKRKRDQTEEQLVHQEVTDKEDRHMKKKIKKKQRLKESENCEDLYRANHNVSGIVPATELSEEAAALDHDTENNSRQRNKRKTAKVEEQSQHHEVTDKADHHMKKKRKKLKEAEHCQDLYGENHNVSDIMPATELSEEAASLDYNTENHSRQRNKRKTAKANADVSSDNTSSTNRETVKKLSYVDRIKDPIKREQFCIKRREQQKRGRMRFKEILNGTFVEDDPIKAELIAKRIRLHEAQIQRRKTKQREKARQLRENNLHSKDCADNTSIINKINRQRYLDSIRQDPIKREHYNIKRREQAKRWRLRRKEILNGAVVEDDPMRIRLRELQRQIREAKMIEKAQQLEENKQLSNKSSALCEPMTETADTSRVEELTDAERSSSSRCINNLQVGNTANVPRQQNTLHVNQPERRKAKFTIADFTVDSSDSVPNLLDYFEHKNLPLYRVYRRMMGKLNARNCAEAPHSFLPGLPLNTFTEDFDGSLPSRYFEKFAYKCTMPCITTRMKNITFKDPLIYTMSVKKDWKMDVFYGLLGAYRTKVAEKTEKRNDKVYSCPEQLVRLAVLLDRDPDPNFDDGYNWYYAGNGNLQVLSVNDTDCLLHSQLSRLYLSKFSRRKLITKNTALACYDCGDENNILETICNLNNYIVIRLKHKIYILKLTTEENALKFHNIKDIDSKLPFTSIEFDNYQKNVLYITKLDGTLQIVNLDLMKCRTLELMTGASIENNWNKVITVDQISYCHVSRNCLKIYDKRTNSAVYEFSDLRENHSELDCDEITAIQKCEDVPFAFLATSHSMFLMDLRWQGIYKPRLLRQWKHHMRNVPTYLTQIKHDLNKDLICLSSQWPEDTCLILNDIDIYDKILQPSSMTLPYGLPTFETTLNAAKNRMLCVDMYHPLEQRVYTSVSGNCVMAADENLLFLTLNSLGDIFAYTLYPDHLDKDDHSLERLHEWGSTMTREKKVYKSSKVIDIAHVLRSLKQVPSDFVIGDRALIRMSESKFDEQAVHEMCNSGEIDGALLDAWLDDEKEDTKVEDTALNIDLHFSDSE